MEAPTLLLPHRDSLSVFFFFFFSTGIWRAMQSLEFAKNFSTTRLHTQEWVLKFYVNKKISKKIAKNTMEHESEIIE